MPLASAPPRHCLAACGGSQPPIGAPGAMPQSQNSAIATHAERGGSWMLPEPKSEDLLYVSEGRYVSVYSYPEGKLEGMLRHFSLSQSMCVDHQGDVFVTDFGANKILLYEHGSTRRVRTLAGDGGPVGCSVDMTTGNLAASDITGNVAIYEDARGSPTTYTSSSLWEAFWCGYDNKGDLFVDGDNYISKGEGFVLLELANGGSELKPITLDQSMGFPGGVQWDGKHMAVGSYYPPPTGVPTIYQFDITGSNATEVGSTTRGDAEDVFQFWIRGKTVVVPDERAEGNGNVLYYHYPAGGSAFRTITKDIHYGPYGVVISLAK